MTAVGKILVFFNLIFSVATAAMIVIVFTTRANWKKEYEEAKRVALIAEAKYKERVAEVDSLKTAGSNESKSKDIAIKSQKDTIDKLAAEVADLKTQVSSEGNKFSKETTSQTSLKTEVGFLRTEREQLNDDVRKLKEQVVEEIGRTNNQKKLAVENKIEADSQRARADQMLRRNVELERDNLALESRVKQFAAEGGSRDGKSSLLNPPVLPPPKDVKGTVLDVGPTGIMVISLGSDSGINVGNKLEVSRLDLVNPERSLYLGEVLISRVDPKKSVGQFIPRAFARASDGLPRKNDTISTGVSGLGR